VDWRPNIWSWKHHRNRWKYDRYTSFVYLLDALCVWSCFLSCNNWFELFNHNFRLLPLFAEKSIFCMILSLIFHFQHIEQQYMWQICVSQKYRQPDFRHFVTVSGLAAYKCGGSDLTLAPESRISVAAPTWLWPLARGMHLRIQCCWTLTINHN